MDLSPNYIPIKLDNGRIVWAKELLYLPTKEEVFGETNRGRKCKNCGEPWQIDVSIFFGDKGPTLTEQRCPNCNADIEGKVYPKKRETAREIKEVELADNPAIEKIIATVLADNPKPVADYKAGKKQAVGFLVGCVLRQFKANPAEVKARLERILNGH